ncbi:hypothetical protein MC885_018190, partial [Smutsia gigantea]
REGSGQEVRGELETGGDRERGLRDTSLEEGSGLETKGRSIADPRTSRWSNPRATAPPCSSGICNQPLWGHPGGGLRSSPAHLTPARGPAVTFDLAAARTRDKGAWAHLPRGHPWEWPDPVPRGLGTFLCPLLQDKVLLQQPAYIQRDAWGPKVLLTPSTPKASVIRKTAESMQLTSIKLRHTFPSPGRGGH